SRSEVGQAAVSTRRAEVLLLWLSDRVVPLRVVHRDRDLLVRTIDLHGARELVALRDFLAGRARHVTDVADPVLVGEHGLDPRLHLRAVEHGRVQKAWFPEQQYRGRSEYDDRHDDADPQTGLRLSCGTGLLRRVRRLRIAGGHLLPRHRLTLLRGVPRRRLAVRILLAVPRRLRLPVRLLLTAARRPTAVGVGLTAAGGR